MFVMGETLQLPGLDARSILPSGLYDRLAGRLEQEHGHQQDKACRIVDETVRFLTLCATYPDTAFAPSLLVDQGWHAFILYTRDYAEFCDRIAGRFLHHQPMDGAAAGEQPPTTRDTVEFMQRAGIGYNAAMWDPAVGRTSWAPSADQQGAERESIGEDGPSCIWAEGPSCVWAESE